MSEFESEINQGAGAEDQKFIRKGKRRNCIFIPGSSDPTVAKLFCDSIQKECFDVKIEEENNQSS